MIYLDNNATTRVAPEVLDAMRPYLSEFFGNPSSAHGLGREMKRAMTRMTSPIDPQVLAELDAARIAISRTADMVEGLQSFIDRRSPVFRGE